MSKTFLNVIENDKNWSKNLTKKKSSVNEVPRGYGKKSIEERWKVLNKNTKYQEYLKDLESNGVKQPEYYRTPMEELLDKETIERCDIFKDNIENFIGTVKIPVGIAGPVRVNGLHAQGDYYIPLATTEAALVASINRGINCINQAGGASAAVVLEGISRDPVFYFKDMIDAGTFLQWANKNFENFKQAAEKTTRHGKLIKVKYTLEANCIHMKCQYTVGDASGQNIITLASEAILSYIEKNTPIKPKKFYLEGGMSGDKKANTYHLLTVRGKRVIAEVLLPKSVVWSTLHCLTEEMHYSSSIGSRGLHMLGAIGINAHFANPITAMSIALGQDPACASEAHIGIARTDLIDGDLYIAVTLPNILVGTVGGGTKLPSQKACLELMGLYGNNKANALAEVMAVVCIAGEISLGAAIISGDFAKAHKLLARDTSKPIDLEKDSLEEAFEKAQALLVKLSSPPSKEVILNVYGLYKQATVGNVNIDKPSLFSLDLKAKAKYEAWKKKKGIKKEEAMKQYIELILNCVKEEKKKLEEEKKKNEEEKKLITN